MVIKVFRQPSNAVSTIGVMFVDGYFQCFTLENSQKIIPEGEYEIDIYYSPKNEMKVPLLKNVPHRSFIEIHPANWAHELIGCIAVGTAFRDDMIYNSRAAFRPLMDKITNAYEVKIIIAYA